MAVILNAELFAADGVAHGRFMLREIVEEITGTRPTWAIILPPSEREVPVPGSPLFEQTQRNYNKMPKPWKRT